MTSSPSSASHASAKSVSSSASAPVFAFTAQIPKTVDGEGAISVSVVTPMYNEEGAAVSLIEEIAAALDGRAFEIIAVNDASTDDTLGVLRGAQASIPQLRVLQHEVNAGQSRGVRTGVLAARAPIVATLDGDGQNNPADIPALLDQLLSADDPHLVMVSGERQKRQDSAAKKIASRWANGIRARLLRDGAKDTGCGLKVFYKEAYLRLPYFDHSHRYLPALMRREGFSTAFAPVSHRPRVHGASKYTNLGRLAVALRDLLGVLWLIDRARPPITISEVHPDAECGTSTERIP